ncbi:MAG: hypothetical protein ACI9D0_001295 [Bacteroidia bacterium]|jgi:hypothetical protein
MREPNSQSDWKSLLIPTMALAVGGFVFGHTLGESPELSAATYVLIDIDGDGLADQQESILGTDAFDPDTDGDGFYDVEELARGTDPLAILDAPGPIPEASLGSTGRTDDGVFRVVNTFYVPAGELQGASIAFGVMINGEIAHLDPLLFFTGASLTVQSASNGLDFIYTLETPIPESLVLSLGSASIFTTFTPAGASTVAKATALNLTSINGVICHVQNATSATGLATQYLPLTDGPEIPITWTPARICTQDLHTIGVVGAVLQQQIDSADCTVMGQDSYCPPDCSSLAGTIVNVIDPLALVGN